MALGPGSIAMIKPLGCLLLGRGLPTQGMLTSVQYPVMDTLRGFITWICFLGDFFLDLPLTYIPGRCHGVTPISNMFLLGIYDNIYYIYRYISLVCIQ